MNFQFTAYLAGLLLLVPLVLLFFYVLRWKRKTRQRIGDEQLVESLVGSYSPQYFRLKFIILIIALTLCIIGAANLRSPLPGNKAASAGVDVMVALDVSNSMLAQDVKPNRLERAKQVLYQLIEKLEGNRMGLVVFAGQAFLQMPLTADLASARMFVSNASPDAVPVQGTVIGDALRICNASLDTKEKKYKAIILITDGEDHDATIESALKDISEYGVVVHTVGIGSAEGSPILDAVTNDYKKDREGNVVISKLNEKDLQYIAAETEGTFQVFTSANETVANIMQDLEQMDKKQIAGSGQRAYQSYFQWFLLAALVLLLVEVIIPEKKMKWLGQERSV